MQTRNIFYIYERSMPESWMQQKRKERVSKIESIRRRKRKIMSEEKREGKHTHESESVYYIGPCVLSFNANVALSFIDMLALRSPIHRLCYAFTYTRIYCGWIWREKEGLARRNRIYFAKGDIVTPLFFPVFNLLL